MIHFAIFKGLNVSTTFPHKDIHKETWYSADGRTANQIHHVLISNRFRSAITDITALRGPDIGSDHNFIHSLVFSLEGRAWQEPEPSHVTSMALAHCILGKFLGVVCHCFLPITTY